MLEASLHALWNIDHDIAREVRLRDDAVDDEEVRIEQDCLRLLTLQQPYGKDFRFLAFSIKVNQDIERVADHATSIAKVALALDPAVPPDWPTALAELGDRVPVMCHSLLRAVLDEDAAAAAAILDEDKIIDGLDKRLYAEIKEWIEDDPSHAEWGLLGYRLGRELERVGDQMVSMAEDVIYLVTGEIIRHQKKRAKRNGDTPA